MGQSSILGAESAPRRHKGADTDALGPSDSSDTGSDVQGLPDDEHAGDTDATGTGERGSVVASERVQEAADVSPDRIRGLGQDASRDQDTTVSIEDLEPTDLDELVAEDSTDEDDDDDDKAA